MGTSSAQMTQSYQSIIDDIVFSFIDAIALHRLLRSPLTAKEMEAR
jgi:hypothetical protein